MIDQTQVLVVADTVEASDYLARQLLPQAGYSVTVANDFTVPPPCHVLLADVTQIRGTPLAGLQAQRRMGCLAPAVLCAVRLTEQMAAEMFSLGVRAFLLKPVSDQVLLDQLAQVVAQVRREEQQAEQQRELEQAQAMVGRRLDEINSLSRIGRAITGLSDLDVILAYIVEAATFMTHANQGAVFLVDEQTGELVLRAQQGIDDQRAQSIARPAHDSDAAYVLQTGQPILRDSGTATKLATGFLVRSLINVPIVIGRKVHGVLAVYNNTEQTFGPADQTVLTSLADYAAIALSKVRTLAEQERRIAEALEAARLVGLHAETLYDPVEGIESQIATLLAGGFGPLTEAQHGAVARIRLATSRIKEIIDLIRQTLEEAEASM